MDVKYTFFFFQQFCARLGSKFGKSAKMSDNFFSQKPT
jgi:hypothetical protein